MRRRRKPLAVLAAGCSVAAILLALFAFPAAPATATSFVPMKVTPSCGALSSTTGYSVHLNATNLSPGTNTLYIGEQGPNHDSTTTVGTLTIPDDGTLDQTVTLPAQSTAAPYEVYVTSARLRGAYGVFSVPCPTLNVQPTCGPADDGSGAHYALTISGANYGPPPPVPNAGPPPTYPLGGAFFPVHIELDGTEVPGSPAKVNAGRDVLGPCHTGPCQGRHPHLPRLPDERRWQREAGGRLVPRRDDDVHGAVSDDHDDDPAHAEHPDHRSHDGTDDRAHDRRPSPRPRRRPRRRPRPSPQDP